LRLGVILDGVGKIQPLRCRGLHGYKEREMGNREETQKTRDTQREENKDRHKTQSAEAETLSKRKEQGGNKRDSNSRERSEGTRMKEDLGTMKMEKSYKGFLTMYFRILLYILYIIYTLLFYYYFRMKINFLSFDLFLKAHIIFFSFLMDLSYLVFV
jgi:hypothetical protein